MNDPHQKCPPSASQDDRLALPTEQGVLLWCMRVSVVGMKRGVAVEPLVDDMLGALGVASASAHLQSFMSALSHGCARMIDVRCVCQRRIAADERALLDVLALAQAMRRFEALLLLRGFMTPAGADAALCSAEAIGHVLLAASCVLPEPEDEVRHYALSPAGDAARPATMTLH